MYKTIKKANKKVHGEQECIEFEFFPPFNLRFQIVYNVAVWIYSCGENSSLINVSLISGFDLQLICLASLE